MCLKSKPNNKYYGIHPFFLKSRTDVQQPETVKTIVPLEIPSAMLKNA